MGTDDATKTGIEQLAAQYAMALDAAGRLVALGAEDVVVREIFTLFDQLFAPGTQRWAQIADGEVQAIWRWREATGDPGADEDFRALAASVPAAETHGFTQDGFWLRLHRGPEALGVVLVEGPVVRHERERFVNAGLGLVGVASLAIANARTYEALRRAESRVAAEHERLTVTLASIGDGVIATDADGRVVIMNPMAEQLTGWSAAEAVGQPVAALLPLLDAQTREPRPDPVAEVLRADRSVLRGAGSVLCARGGGERLVAKTGAPIHGPDGELRGAVLVLRDVTEEERLRRIATERSKSASLSLLAGGIAHDFNNWLAVVIGNVSLLKGDAVVHSDRVEMLADADRALVACQGLARQLLTLATGGAPVRRRGDVGELVRSVADLALRGARCRVVTRGGDRAYAAQIDRSQVAQVLTSLLDNAQQALPLGGDIEIHTDLVDAADVPDAVVVAGRYVRIRVSDDGVGVPREHLSRVFDPFFTTRPKGSGLGLSTSQAIVRAHGGAMALTSTPGAGTTVTVLLPADEIGPAAVLAPATVRARARIGAGRALLMDDEPGVLRVLRRILESDGWSVTATAHGEEAITAHAAALERGDPFDILVVDLTVPGGLGGADVLAAVRQRDATVPIVASSGYWSPNDPGLSTDVGFSDALPKPYSAADVRGVFARVLGDRR